MISVVSNILKHGSLRGQRQFMASHALSVTGACFHASRRAEPLEKS